MHKLPEWVRPIVFGAIIGLALFGVDWGAALRSIRVEPEVVMARQSYKGNTKPAVEVAAGETMHEPYVRNASSAEWTVTANGTDAATATKAAVAGKSHYLTGIIASTAPGGTALFTVKDDTTAILAGSSWALTGGDGLVCVQFAHPIKITAGKAVSLEASGSGTTYANLMGFTR